jgi:ABC-type glutathione transport system ATPase component
VQQGIAVIVISSELPEVLGLSDRVLVMHEGKLKANLINQNLTQEQVMEAAEERTSCRKAIRLKSNSPFRRPVRSQG